MTWLQFETHQSIPELLFKTGAIAFEFKGRPVLPYEEDIIMRTSRPQIPGTDIHRSYELNSFRIIS
jgi:hypothetical protein